MLLCLLSRSEQVGPSSPREWSNPHFGADGTFVLILESLSLGQFLGYIAQEAETQTVFMAHEIAMPNWFLKRHTIFSSNNHALFFPSVSLPAKCVKLNTVFFCFSLYYWVTNKV